MSSQLLTMDDLLTIRTTKENFEQFENKIKRLESKENLTKDLFEQFENRIKKLESKDLSEQSENSIKKLEPKENVTNKWLPQSNLASTLYRDVDFLPLEVNNLNIYIPKQFRICHSRSWSSDEKTYIVEYDYYRFSALLNRELDELIFRINNDRTLNGSTILKNVFYQCPNKIVNWTGLCMGELNDIPTSIAKAKELYGDKWDDALSFGIAVFHYWIRAYLQCAPVCLKMVNMFEKKI